MAKQIIRGRNVSCRDCVYVLNPRFPLHVEDSVLRSRPSESYRVTCCRRAPPVTADATLLRKHTPTELVKLPDGTTARMADVCYTQVVGATNKAAAILAVEEAAIIAGWACRS